MSRPFGVFPFAPLQAVLDRRLPEISITNPDGSVQLVHAGDHVRASEVLGVSRRALTRWAAGQHLTLRAADECATRLGMHPTAIWADFDELCDRIDQQRIAARHASRARARARARRTHDVLEVA